MKETVDFSSWCSRRLNAVLFVAMMMAMSVQGCDLALMVLQFSFDWSMVSPDRDGLPDLADWHDDGGVQCVGLHPVLPKGLLEPVQGGGEFQRETSPPQDPHRDGEQRKVKHSRFNLFGEPAGHDPEACGSDRDGELWDEPAGGDVNHLLLEGEEEEGEEQEQEDVPQLENLTETAYTLHLWWRTH